jgi:hypothetical protein
MRPDGDNTMFKKILIANRGESGRQADSAKPKRVKRVSAKPKRVKRVSAEPQRVSAKPQRVTRVSADPVRVKRVSAQPDCMAREACAGDFAAGSQHV